MRADGPCPDCGAPLRAALDLATDEAVVLDPRPDPAGDVWVDEFADGVPYIRIGNVPASMPLRYRVHSCM